MVSKNKINIKLFIFIGLILLIIVGVTLIINFYPTTSTPGEGPILNRICRGPVNDAVKTANTQCTGKINNAVGAAKKICTDGLEIYKDVLLTQAAAEYSKIATTLQTPKPFQIYIELPATTASSKISGNPNGKIGLPITINSGESYVIDWGDRTPYITGSGTLSTDDDNLKHVYTKLPGKYTISVYTKPYSIPVVSLNLNGSAQYLTYKDQGSDKDLTYIKKIVTGDNSPPMNVFTSGGGMAPSATEPEDWGIQVVNNATPAPTPCPTGNLICPPESSVNGLSTVTIQSVDLTLSLVFSNFDSVKNIQTFTMKIIWTTDYQSCLTLKPGDKIELTDHLGRVTYIDLTSTNTTSFININNGLRTYETLVNGGALGVISNDNDLNMFYVILVVHGIDTSPFNIQNIKVNTPTPTIPVQTEFTVILTAFGTNKTSVVNVVKNITGLNLESAKILVDGAPKPVIEGVSKDDANKYKALLEGAGATVLIK